jgi:uncharacterized membrane protein
MLTRFKKALFRGLVILVPLALLWITIRETASMMVTLAEPIADLLPDAAFDWVRHPELVAPVVVVVVATLFGVLASVGIARRVGASLERHTVGRLPAYRMVKTFVTAYLRMENASSFMPALILGEDGGAVPCYVIEDDAGKANVVVMLPRSPASFSGSIAMIPRQKIERLDLSFDQFSLSLSNFGLGMSALLDRHASGNAKGNPEP